jgi:hypothetical protein
MNPRLNRLQALELHFVLDNSVLCVRVWPGAGAFTGEL